MKSAVPYITVVAVLIAALGGYTVIHSSNNPKSPNSLSSSTIFTFQNAGLEIPGGQPPPCQALGPQGPLPCYAISNANLYGTVFVNASSPLSCIDVNVNGTSEGSSCWNLTATGFPFSYCSGSGSNYSCTTTLEPNNYTQKTRTIPFSFNLLNGSNNAPVILAGKPYLMTLTANFQDGTDSTVSMTLIAWVNNNYYATTVTTSSTTTSNSK